MIAGHLALEMAQNCIVLQMLERDKQKGTSVHRTGNCEFLAIVDTFKSDSPKTQPLRILQLIQDSCLQFDELASSYSPQYQTRSAAVIPWIEEVRLELTKRIG